VDLNLEIGMVSGAILSSIDLNLDEAGGFLRVHQLRQLSIKYYGQWLTCAEAIGALRLRSGAGRLEEHVADGDV
jgi:hypothetical protein